MWIRITSGPSAMRYLGFFVGKRLLLSIRVSEMHEANVGPKAGARVYRTGTMGRHKTTALRRRESKT